MARKSVKMKKIDGVIYYTSTYFAEEVYLSKRAARSYLADFKSIEGHTNPRLYEKAVMDKAVDSYKNGISTKEIYEKKRMEKLMNEEYERAGIEEDEEWEFRSKWEPKDNEEDYYLYYEEQYEKNRHQIHLDNEFRNVLPIKMLECLFYIQGYEFDIQKFQEDFILHDECESFRDPGDVRTEEHVKAVDRLESPNAYLRDI